MKALIHKHPYWVTTALIWLIGVIFLLNQYPDFSNVILLFIVILLLPLSLYLIFYTAGHARQQPNTTTNHSFANFNSAALLKEINEIKQQLLIQDKMASVGMLTAGIAHEIKNPLNFVNNFSDMANSLLVELKEELNNSDLPQEKKEEIYGIIKDLEENLASINQHGKRAESIVKHILMQSHTEELTKIEININELVDEYLHLAYHGMRAQNPDFNVSLKTDFAPNLPMLKVSPQNVGRVFLNIINNGLYAAYEKKKCSPAGFMPTIEVKTEKLEDSVKIIIKDNGMGIPDELKEKIFDAFFTTKPIGVGTGLGLHICHDIIIKQHSGTIDVDAHKGEYTKFIITFPLKKEQKN